MVGLDRRRTEHRFDHIRADACAENGIGIVYRPKCDGIAPDVGCSRSVWPDGVQAAFNIAAACDWNGIDDRGGLADREVLIGVLRFRRIVSLSFAGALSHYIGSFSRVARCLILPLAIVTINWWNCLSIRSGRYPAHISRAHHT